MQNTQLFIPTKCKVGFNLREDCYTKKLGYVIAFDGKKWRKEQSWESWRQKVGQEKYTGGKYIDGKWVNNPVEYYGEEVTPIEFDNVPTSGFVLNKKVGGYKSDWNMRQTYARVYDPRGFEFEINIVNLLYILETSNCMKGKGLEGEFVYSWDGKDLVLLPCHSWEYEKANNYTSLQSEKVSSKTLVPGCSYKTKKEEDIIYVGRFNWYNIDFYGKNPTRAGKKYHIFTSDNGESFDLKTDASFLALKNSDEIVSNYAEIIEKFQNNIHSSNITDWEFREKEIDFTPNEGHQSTLKNGTYFKLDGDIITECSVWINYQYQYNTQTYKNDYVIKGYYLRDNYSFNKKDLSGKYFSSSYGYYYNSSYDRTFSKEDLQKNKYYDIVAILENGKKINLKSLSEL